MDGTVVLPVKGDLAGPEAGGHGEAVPPESGVHVRQHALPGIRQGGGEEMAARHRHDGAHPKKVFRLVQIKKEVVLQIVRIGQTVPAAVQQIADAVDPAQGLIGGVEGGGLNVLDHQVAGLGGEPLPQEPGPT